MKFPINFIAATEEFCTFKKNIAAPYLRKSFNLSETCSDSKIIICGLGFYELYINGVNITKGSLAPYISSPDDLIYYDEYEISKLLLVGENVIGVLLGNGLQNAFSANIWNFDTAKWVGAPKVALRLDNVFIDGKIQSVESDESFKTSPSPIYFDELRCGAYYDARNEQTGWNNIGFDDSNWQKAKKAPMPKGEPAICNAEPIIVTKKLKPVSITTQEDGYLYDFGVNSAGICKLSIIGELGQKIEFEHGEYLVDGKLSFKNIQFVPDGYTQKDIYICKGEGEEIYIPKFTYHGFQYVHVIGIKPEQATDNLLTYLVMNSDLEERGNFECSDNTANIL